MARRRSVPAPDESVWLTGIRWVQAVRMQADCFEFSFYEFQSALLDADARRRFNAEDDLARSWRASGNARGIVDRPSRVPTELLAMQVASELDFLLVAVRTVQRAQHRLPQHLATAMTGEDELKALRDLVETTTTPTAQPRRRCAECRKSRRAASPSPARKPGSEASTEYL
jgi:hypothetical protein